MTSWSQPPWFSAPLVRAKYACDYPEMVREHTLNESDHRAAILHLDTETYLRMPPRAMQDNVKVRIRAVTSPLERGEQSNVAQARMGEIDAMLGTDPQKYTAAERQHDGEACQIRHGSLQGDKCLWGRYVCSHQPTLRRCR